MNFVILLFALFFSSSAYTQGQEDFNNPTLTDWLISNQSVPVGGTTWQQPVSGIVFSAHQGTNDQYFFANFNSTGTNGTICNYLIMPANVFGNLSFFTRTTIAQDGVTIFSDRLTVRYSPTAGITTGNCTTDFGDFTDELVVINENLDNTNPPPADAFPIEWTEYTAEIPGNDGRIAFIYFVTGAGSQGINSNYIGLDTVSWTGDIIFSNGFEN